MNRYKNLQEIKTDGLELAAGYEARGSFEMAYISIWLVLEKGLRIYADEGTKSRLHDKIRNWDKYLEGKTNKKPDPIKSFNTEYTSRSIPHISIIESVLGKMNYVRMVMDSNKKWRRRRNSIAHNAEHFGTEKTYKEYKHDLLNAINQLMRHAAKHNDIAGF